MLRDVVYAVAVMLWSVVDLCLLVAGVSVTVSVLALVVGVLVWFGFTWVLRWSTRVDLALATWQRRGPNAPARRRAPTVGVLSALRTVAADPQTWRDLLWVALNSVLGFAFGIAVAVAVGLVLVCITLPAWFWAVPDPDAHLGVTNLGVFTVDSVGTAFGAVALGLAFAPVSLLLASFGARAHAGLAVRLLGAPTTTDAAQAKSNPRKSSANAASHSSR